MTKCILGHNKYFYIYINILCRVVAPRRITSNVGTDSALNWNYFCVCVILCKVVAPRRITSDVGTDPALNWNYFCFWMILCRVVAPRCITSNSGPILLWTATFHSSSHYGEAAIAQHISKVGNKFTKFIKQWNEFFNNELVISRAFHGKIVKGRSLNWAIRQYYMELIFATLTSIIA